MVNPATGKQHERPILVKGTAQMEVLPCQEPKGCVSPGERTCKEKFPINRWHDLEPYIKELLDAQTAEIHFAIAARSKLPPRVVNWETGTFQVNFSSATMEELNKRGKKPPEEPETEEKLSSHLWRYQWWENDTSKNEEEIPEEEALPAYLSEPSIPPFGARLRQEKKEQQWWNREWEREFEVTTEQGFEQSKEEALAYYRLFTEVVAEIDNARARAWFKKNEEVFKTIRAWFENDWPARGKKWPFPIKQSGPRRPIGFGDGLKLKCPECGHEWERRVKYWYDDRLWKHVDYDVKKGLCPNPKCSKPIQPRIIGHSWLEIISSTAVLEVDDAMRKAIKDKMNEAYSVPLLTINFKLDKPKQNTGIETEMAVLHRSAQLKEVAEELRRHLEVLDKARVERIMKVRGYADSSASCAYNVNLSQKRADWVVKKLKNDYNLKLEPNIKVPPPDPTLTPVETIGCGKAFSGNKQFKELWESEKTQRQTSGDQPVDENEAERVVVVELCAPEKKKSN